MALTLHGYWRSSASYRVRIALNLKRLKWDHVGVHLVEAGGMQNKSEFATLNPQKLVPVLVVDGVSLTQSMSIMEYVDEQYPEPPLLPKNAVERAYVRSLCEAIACEIHPLNNLRVLTYLTSTMQVSEHAKADWYQHWVKLGFEAVETMLSKSSFAGDFCAGDAPGMADCCLIPQVYNARRFNVPMDLYPQIQRIEKTCLTLPAFKNASPENQPDAA